MKANARVAAIVPTYNRKELLRRCLSSLLAQTRQLEEIVVVNNASTDGTVCILETEFPEVTVLSLCANLGPISAVCRGLEYAYRMGYDYMWIMDDDAYASRDALERLLVCLETHSNDRGVVLYSIYCDEKAPHNFSEPIWVFEEGEIKRIDKLDSMRAPIVKGLGGPLLGVLIPRGVISEIGLPREDTFIWGEYEWFRRIRKAGFEVYYVSTSVIFHPSLVQMVKTVMLPTGVLKLKRPFLRPISVPLLPPWKYYYALRNSLYFTIHSDEEQDRIKILKILKVIPLYLLRASVAIAYSREKVKMIRACSLAIFDGIKGRMGVRLLPE